MHLSIVTITHKGSMQLHLQSVHCALVRFGEALLECITLMLFPGCTTENCQQDVAQLSVVLHPAFVINVRICVPCMQGRVSGTGKQTSFNWFWTWSGVWPAICSRLSQKQADIKLQIAIHGPGIEHVNSVHATLGDEQLVTRIVRQENLMGNNRLFPSGGQDLTLFQAALAVLMISRPPTQPMVMEVELPARLVERARLQLASTGTLELSVTVQSDFCSSSAPVTFRSDSQALQESVAGILAVCRLATAMLLRKSTSGDQLVGL